MIRAIVVHPAEAPVELVAGVVPHAPGRVASVHLDTGKVWDQARAIIDGPIEPVYLTLDDEEGWHLAAYVNEDGIGLGLTPSAQVTGGPVLHGPVVIVRERVDEEGEIHYAGLTAGDLWALQNLVGVLTPVAVAVRPPTEVN